MAETLQKSIRKSAQDHRQRNYTSFHGRTKHQERTIYNGRTIKSITAYLFYFIYFSIKYGKACGLDEIPVEVWKLKEFHEILLECCNSVYQQEVISSWRKGCILPFPKKGNLNITKNYRGITLTAISAKIYNLMLLNKIRPAVDPLLPKNQNGFRRKRSTMGQILNIRRILEGVRANNLPAVLLFIDFSKAFDSIHRGKMRGILIAYGIPQETVDAIMIPGYLLHGTLS